MESQRERNRDRGGAYKLRGWGPVRSGGGGGATVAGAIKVLVNMGSWDVRASGGT